MEYIIREMRESEYPLIKDFCYEAIFIPEGEVLPPRLIVEHPLLQVYYVSFGSEVHDRALVAEADGKVVGAVWVRIMNDYGHVDDETPSFAISLYKEYRGYEKASLLSQKANYAVKMYRNLGFEIIAENEEEYIMVYDLQRKRD